MVRRWTLRRVTENWRLKLAALALAVLLWAVVSAEQVTTQWLPIPVEVELRDPGFARAGGPSPTEVSVRFAGPARELWELAVNRPTLALRVDRAGDGRRVYVVEPQMVRIPRELSVNAVDVRPATVQLAFQRVETREVPVRVTMAPEAQRRWVVVDSLRPSPARVTVSGPASLLARVAEVTTRPLPLGLDSVVSRRVALDVEGLDGLRLDAGSVAVTGRLEPRMEQVLAAVPVATPPGFVAVPATVEVRVEGGRSRVAGLAPGTVTLAASADSLAPSGGDAAVQVRGLPAGMTARVTPGRVRLAPPAAAAPPTSAPATGTTRPIPTPSTTTDTTRGTP